MTSVDVCEVFEALAPLVAPALERVFGRRDLCVLATRVAIETARYFGIDAAPVTVKLTAYNRAFAGHVARDFADVEDPSRPSTWGDGSWSVGIGHGRPPGSNGWDGHLIAVAAGWFGDFSVQQIERLGHGIVTGPAIVGECNGSSSWRVTDGMTGTVVEYQRTVNNVWRDAPDWKDEKRRRPIVGKLIRELRGMEVRR